MTIGERIKEARLSAGLTQSELGEKIGEVKQTIYKYEKGIITNIPSNNIEAIARACGSTPEYIMGWNDADRYAAAKLVDICMQLNDEGLLKVIAYVRDILPQYKK